MDDYEIARIVAHGCDGPATQFVQLCRLFEMVESGQIDAERAANYAFDSGLVPENDSVEVPSAEFPDFCG